VRGSRGAWQRRVMSAWVGVGGEADPDPDDTASAHLDKRCPS
jgi:hypothetical protein